MDAPDAPTLQAAPAGPGTVFSSRRGTVEQVRADNAREEAGERAALCKAVFTPMKAWYRGNPALAAAWGAFPFRRELKDWEHFSAVHHQYVAETEGGAPKFVSK